MAHLPDINIADARQRITDIFVDYELSTVLGQGSFGVVWKAVSLLDKEEVAIKCIRKAAICYTSLIRDRLLKVGMVPKEIFILSRLQHPNIIRFIDYREDGEYHYLVTEVPNKCMDLFDFIDLHVGMSEDRIKHIFKQLVSALLHMQEKGYVHRDIKDENVLIDENDNVYLIDFGYAHHIPRFQSDFFTDLVGTEHAMSPEIFRKEAHNGLPQDIWALGILFYTLLFGGHPFNDCTLASMSSGKIYNLREHILKEEIHRSDEAQHLLMSMLELDVEKRITLSDIMKHVWVDGNHVADDDVDDELDEFRIQCAI